MFSNSVSIKCQSPLFNIIPRREAGLYRKERNFDVTASPREASKAAGSIGKAHDLLSRKADEQNEGPGKGDDQKFLPSDRVRVLYCLFHQANDFLLGVDLTRRDNLL